MYNFFIKRFIDFMLSILMLAFFLPLLIVLVLGLYVANNGKPFFFQTRPGKDERLFRIIKFKTMNDKKDSNGQLLPDEQRMTRIGSFIRKTSLDEIPQLINVVKGDMSLVGPRPLLPEYIPLYSETQRKRHIVKPGITGWAQINGRNAISWAQKFEYDVWYTEHISFLLDVKILFLTVKKVFIREGINQADKATMDFFTGNE